MGQQYSHSTKRTPPLPYVGTKHCSYGCEQIAKWQYKSGKLCCSPSYNSCPEKRRKFSDEVDHKVYSAKSLATRTRLGITKSCQIKGAKTRIANGTYERVAAGTRKRWATNPYTNNRSTPIASFKDTSVIYQGSYERLFLERLETERGLTWLQDHVKRGPGIWYEFEGTKRLYLPDFLIGNIIYEIKSLWTWKNNGTNQKLESQNQSKLLSAKDNGYQVILVLDHKEIEI